MNASLSWHNEINVFANDNKRVHQLVEATDWIVDRFSYKGGCSEIVSGKYRLMMKLV